MPTKDLACHTLSISARDLLTHILLILIKNTCLSTLEWHFLSHAHIGIIYMFLCAVSQYALLYDLLSPSDELIKL